MVFRGEVLLNLELFNDYNGDPWLGLRLDIDDGIPNLRWLHSRD
jgi:hypothetical protein